MAAAPTLMEVEPQFATKDKLEEEVEKIPRMRGNEVEVARLRVAWTLARAESILDWEEKVRSETFGAA